VANEVLERLKVKKHQDKTTMGRIQKGLDFLGYAISPRVLNPSPRSIDHMRQGLTRLYEQGADYIAAESYLRSWLSWLNGGLQGLIQWTWEQVTDIFCVETGVLEKTGQLLQNQLMISLWVI